MHVLLENMYLTQENKVSTTLQHLILRLEREAPIYWHMGYTRIARSNNGQYIVTLTSD